MLHFRLALAALFLCACASQEALDDPVERAHPTTIAASPRGDMIAVGATDGSLWFVETSSNAISRRIRVGGGEIWNICFSPDGSIAAVAAMREARPWEKPNFEVTWSLVRTRGTERAIPLLLAHPFGADARFSPDGARLLVFMHEGQLRLVDCATGVAKSVLPPAGNYFTTACWWDNDKLVTGDSRGVVSTVSADTGVATASMPALPAKIDCVEISLDHTQLLTTFGAKARLWRLSDLTLETEFEADWYLYTEGDGMFHAAWSDDRLLIASGTLYQLECRRRDGSLVWMHNHPYGPARPVCSFDPTARLASCAGHPGLVFDVGSGVRRTDGVLVSDAWSAIEWTGDGKSVALLAIPPAAVTIADTASFTPKCELRINERGDLLPGKWTPRQGAEMLLARKCPCRSHDASTVPSSNVKRCG